MSTLGKSTYNQIIDDVLEDAAEVSVSVNSTPDRMKRNILRAEQIITDECNLSEEYVLRLSKDVDEYFIQDRPLITGASLTSPITLTIPAHGIPNHRRIHVSEIVGNTAANGDWFTSGVATNSLVINPGVYIRDVQTDDAGLKITTDEEHNFDDGATITIADFIDGPIPDGDHVITLVDDEPKAFTIALSPADPTYNGGGVAYWKLQSTGNAAYVSGGRVWMDSEIPTYFGRFHSGRRISGSVVRKFSFINNGELLFNENWQFEDPGYNWYDAPWSAAHARRSGQRYIRFYPLPDTGQDVRLYGSLKIIPSLYLDDSLDSVIHLESEFEETIKAYVLSKALRAKDPERADAEMNVFRKLLKERAINALSDVVHTTRVVYR